MTAGWGRHGGWQGRRRIAGTRKGGKKERSGTKQKFIQQSLKHFAKVKEGGSLPRKTLVNGKHQSERKNFPKPGKSALKGVGTSVSNRGEVKRKN